MTALDRTPEDAYYLVDDAGDVLGWTVIDRRSDPTRAEPLVRSAGVAAEAVAHVAARDLAGMRVATSDEQLARALVTAGGTLVRHATVMIAHPMSSEFEKDAAAGPSEVASLASFPRTQEELVPLLAETRLAAYAASHSDHDAAADRADMQAVLRELLCDAALGPVHAELSAVVLTTEGRPVGAIIVTIASADAIWPGGPWIADLFVDPRLAGKGMGRRLLGHALTTCAALSFPRIGLVVSHGNPAVGLYRSMGFTDLLTSWAVTLPVNP